MLYMLYIVADYKYTEYKRNQYIEELTNTNNLYISEIQKSQFLLENKTTKAYKNKILKSQQWMKNKWEEVVFLIEEDKYKEFTENNTGSWGQRQNTQIVMTDEERMIQSMTIYQKWIYLIFKKDIR